MSDWSRLASGWKSSALGILLSLSSVMAEAGPAVYLQSGHSQRVLSIAVSPDRRTLASSGADGGIKLWDLSNGRELRTLEGLAQVNSVAFSRDGGTLAAGSTDHGIRLWDVGRGSLLRTLTGHTQAVT
jgi:WD40 repeat protein